MWLKPKEGIQWNGLLSIVAQEYLNIGRISIGDFVIFLVTFNMYSQVWGHAEWWP